MNGKDNCLILLSSRSGDFLEAIRSQMKEELRITGFSQENITLCTQKYLGREKSIKFLLQAENVGIHHGSYLRTRYSGLLHIPIILLMSCAVFLENKCLPSSKTQLFQQVIHMCISRTTLKTMGKNASEVENLHKLMVILGKLAWTALTRESKQLLLYKVSNFCVGDIISTLLVPRVFRKSLKYNLFLMHPNMSNCIQSYKINQSINQ